MIRPDRPCPYTHPRSGAPPLHSGDTGLGVGSRMADDLLVCVGGIDAYGVDAGAGLHV